MEIPVKIISILLLVPNILAYTLVFNETFSDGNGYLSRWVTASQNGHSYSVVSTGLQNPPVFSNGYMVFIKDIGLKQSKKKILKIRTRKPRVLINEW
jgi:hypothetical protein